MLLMTLGLCLANDAHCLLAVQINLDESRREWLVEPARLVLVGLLESSVQACSRAAHQRLIQLAQLVHPQALFLVVLDECYDLVLTVCIECASWKGLLVVASDQARSYEAFAQSRRFFSHATCLHWVRIRCIAHLCGSSLGRDGRLEAVCILAVAVASFGGGLVLTGFLACFFECAGGLSKTNFLGDPAVAAVGPGALLVQVGAGTLAESIVEGGVRVVSPLGRPDASADQLVAFGDCWRRLTDLDDGDRPGEPAGVIRCRRATAPLLHLFIRLFAALRHVCDGDCVVRRLYPSGRLLLLLCDRLNLGRLRARIRHLHFGSGGSGEVGGRFGRIASSGE